jgi:NAD+ synthase
MSETLHICLAQLNPVVGAVKANTDKIIKVWQECANNTDIIVFSEMIICGYPPEDLILKPFFIDLMHEAVERLVQESQTRKPYIFVSCPWRHQDGKIYSALHLIGDGKLQQTSFKHHLPNDGVFDEKRVLSAGPLPAPFAFKGHKIGGLICEDMWHSDVSAHLKAQGADILVCVNGSPFDYLKQNIRQELAQKRAQETGLPILYVNQCGGQDELVFDGGSFATNESGTVIFEAEQFIEDTHITQWTKNDGGHFLCLSENNATFYDKHHAIYQALVTGLRDYVVKNGFSGVLIGMSGGIDSALSAAIATDALGAEAVHCVMMPSQYTSNDSLNDAKACAEALGVRYESIPITASIAAFHDVLSGHFHDSTPQVTFENMQSRARALILMTLSNADGFMVLSTGNKSELAVGYATLYGDMCGGFNALKDVYKTQVYALSKWRNEHKPRHGFGPHGAVIPNNIITKAPTAELKDNQTDQDTLPDYDVLDDILHGLIEQDLGIDELTAKGHGRALIIKIWNMLDLAEYKRRQAPPGVKITPRAFGRDRRYPITNKLRQNLKS